MNPKEASERFYKEVWPHAATVLRTAQFLSQDETEADDLAQETMVKAFRNLDRFAEGTDVKAWLMTILRHTRIDRLRSAAASHVERSLEQLVVEPAAPADSQVAASHDPEALLEEFADRQIIAALRALPEEIRWALLLVDVEGMDHSDAAGVLDVPVGTVKSRAHRGRAMLRGALMAVAEERRMIANDRRDADGGR